jgi:hypothetical protein
MVLLHNMMRDAPQNVSHNYNVLYFDFILFVGWKKQEGEAKSEYQSEITNNLRKPYNTLKLFCVIDMGIWNIRYGFSKEFTKGFPAIFWLVDEKLVGRTIPFHLLTILNIRINDIFPGKILPKAAL